MEGIGCGWIVCIYAPSLVALERRMFCRTLTDPVDIIIFQQVSLGSIRERIPPSNDVGSKLRREKKTGENCRFQEKWDYYSELLGALIQRERIPQEYQKAILQLCWVQTPNQNFWQVNEVTKYNGYLLSQRDHLLSDLDGAKYIFFLGLSKGVSKC